MNTSLIDNLSQEEINIAFDLLNGTFISSNIDKELQEFSQTFSGKIQKHIIVNIDNFTLFLEKIELRNCENCGKLESFTDGGGYNDDGEEWCSNCLERESEYK